MGLRFSKRLGGNKGWGLNLSNSGVSSSYRSKFGTIGSKGFSIRSGIPGFSYRSSWGNSKSKGSGAMIVLTIMGTLFLGYLIIVILYNSVRLIWWLLSRTYHFALRNIYNWQERRKL